MRISDWSSDVCSSDLFSYDNLGKHISPFLLLDHAAPTEFSPTTERRGVGQHPHRGFETVTIVYQGELEHRDSTGSGGKIGPRSEEHTSELQSLMRLSYAVFRLKKKTHNKLNRLLHN